MMTGKAEGACANCMMSLGDSESKEWTAQQGQSRSSKIGTQHHCLPMAQICGAIETMICDDKAVRIIKSRGA